MHFERNSPFEKHRYILGAENYIQPSFVIKMSYNNEKKKMKNLNYKTKTKTNKPSIKKGIHFF